MKHQAIIALVCVVAVTPVIAGISSQWATQADHWQIQKDAKSGKIKYGVETDAEKTKEAKTKGPTKTVEPTKTVPPTGTPKPTKEPKDITETATSTVTPTASPTATPTVTPTVTVTINQI